MPPSPRTLMISYWLMRTPGCGAALVAWTAVETPSNESHADDFAFVPATDERFERCGTVCACGGATIGFLPGGGVPCAIDGAGPVGGPDGSKLAFAAGLPLPMTIVESLGPEPPLL